MYKMTCSVPGFSLTVGELVAVDLGVSVTDVGHDGVPLKPTAGEGINTLGLTPGILPAGLPVMLVALEDVVRLLENLSHFAALLKREREEKKQKHGDGLVVAVEGGGGVCVCVCVAGVAVLSTQCHSFVTN